MNLLLFPSHRPQWGCVQIPLRGCFVQFQGQILRFGSSSGSLHFNEHHIRWKVRDKGVIVSALHFQADGVEKTGFSSEKLAKRCAWWCREASYSGDVTFHLLKQIFACYRDFILRKISTAPLRDKTYSLSNSLQDTFIFPFYNSGSV